MERVSRWTARPRPWQLPLMAKDVALFGTLLAIGYAAIGCASDPFVIGHYVPADRDASSGPDTGPDPDPRDSAAESDADTDGGPLAHDDECQTTYPDALACSQFEDNDLGAGWDDLVETSSANLERSQDLTHAGDGALHASTSGRTSRAAVVRKFDPLYAGELYIRAYLYVPDALPTQTMNIFFIGDDRPSEDEDDGVDFNLENGAIQAFLANETPTRYTGTEPIPRNQWFCFRARVVLSDDAGSVDAYANEALMLHADGLDTVPDRGVRHFRAGIDWSSEQDDYFEIYMDDLVFDRREIPCW
jgi:hypothetical protein